MCGIVGMVALDRGHVPTQHLRWMSAAASHRGPDDSGFYVESGAALGMTRLSIIDRDGGRQPVRNEDGSVWVVLNGEIYNYRELTKQLLAQGHVFSSASDTEVIVHLYEELGADCVRKLNGMFAFALWDRRRRVLLLARDRLGIKPLYYTINDGTLFFGSELKSILQVPSVERRIDWSAFGHMLAFLHTPATRSIIEGVRKLEPGHVLLARPESEPVLRRYWDLRFQPDESRTEDAWIVELKDRLRSSVLSHLVSEVPVGAFLSGGVDSSAVVAFMSTMVPEPVKTFSIGFAEPEYDEQDAARVVARRLGTEHHELILGPGIADDLEEIAWYLDEPFGDSSAIPTYFVSRLASEHVTVVLSGDGGDEIFAGYDKYLVERRERRLEALAAPARPLLRAMSRLLPYGVRGHNLASHYALRGADRYLDSVTLFRSAQLARLLGPAALERVVASDPAAGEQEIMAGGGGDWLSTLQYYDIRSYLPLDILTKVDRMSMANSIETRVPLLDHELVEFAATIPSSLKLRNGETKYIFKRALAGILPPSIIRRRKHGFAVPLDKWFRGPLREFLSDHLLSGSCGRRGIFDQRQIERLVSRHQAGRDLGLHLWTLLSFELWCQRYLDRVPPAAAREAHLGTGQERVRKRALGGRS